jgi:very-short-patch-repair endonuclease
MYHAPPKLIDNARKLRRVLTISEQRLWNWLRNRTFGGYKFRRQFPVDHYILDFYCADLKFAIEVDGRQHEVECVREYDEERTRELLTLGICVLRIPNVLLATDPLLVEEQLRFAIEQREREVRQDRSR